MTAPGRLWLRLFSVFLLASVVPIALAGTLGARWLSETARDDARVRLTSLGDLGGTLVRNLVVSARDKLVILGRSMGTRASRADGGEPWTGQAIDRELGTLIEPRDVFLDLHFYSNALPPQILAQRAAPELEVAQKLLPDPRAAQSLQFQRNARTEAVQRPLANRTYEAVLSERNYGFPTLTLSAPVAAEDRVHGALVGYLDLRELTRVLDPIRTAGGMAAVYDRDGAPLGSTGEVGGDILDVERPVGHGDWTIRVALPTEQIEAGAAGLARRVFLGTGVAAVLAVLASLGLASWIARPVHRLTAAADAMSQGDLSVRTGIDRGDELGRLGRAFDRMATAVEQLDSAKSEFVASVSHELRTPLTSMQLALENIRDGLVAPVDDGLQPSLARVHRDTQRLLRLVEDLLQLARLDAGVERPQPVAVDLAGLARSLAGTLAPLAEQAGRTLRVDGAGRAHVDPQLATRILTNLCDNALKYSTEGSEVAVLVAPGRLEVRNDGAGLDPERHIDRFARGAAAPGTGSGLGLDIVARLVERSRARLEFRTLPGPQTAVVVHFPGAAR